MKLSEAREAFYYNSGVVSDLCRKLSYSGIAVVWLAKTQTDLSIQYKGWWVWIIVGYVLALTFDLFQYLHLGESWKIYYRRKIKKGSKPDDDVKPPEVINRWGTVFYYAKISITLITTVALLVALFEALQSEKKSGTTRQSSQFIEGDSRCLHVLDRPFC